MIAYINIIQRAETKIMLGTDLTKHNYSYNEVCKIIDRVVSDFEQRKDFENTYN